MRNTRQHDVVFSAVLIVMMFATESVFAIDASVVPFWDAEPNAPGANILMNRYGGGTPNQFNTTVSRTTSVSHAGDASFLIDSSVSNGGFGFFQTPLAGGGPGPGYNQSRDIARFDATSFWLRNDTGAAFSLKYEVKDYRDDGGNSASYLLNVPAATGWNKYTIPLDIGTPGWSVNGSPDLERARFLAFVIEANQGQAVNGSLYVDDVSFIEPGGPVDTQTAPINVLAETLARRQWDGMWQSRSRANGLIPSHSTSGQTGALNSTSAVLKMLPGAVNRGWVSQTDADDYVNTLVGTFNTIMDDRTYLPARYYDWVTLDATSSEESSIDSAFLFLALHQFKQLPSTSPALRNNIQSLQDRFNFAAFADTTAPNVGWKLAYFGDTGQFTTGTYDGYSGEVWLMSLAAELAQANHVDIETLYHSAVFRQEAFLVDPDKSHLVHSFDQFRAPFLQWLLPMFVDVSDRGADTYPNQSLAVNPYHNAVRYQQEVDAKLAQLGRDGFLQPDAGDDGSGTQYEQYSLYNDFGRPDLFMPWSSTLALLGDPESAEQALRTILEAGLHGPLGLTDSARWTTGQDAPYQFTAFHDFWNLALSTMALMQFLYDDNAFLTNLPEVDNALDRVFLNPADFDADGDVDLDDYDILSGNYGDTSVDFFDGDANGDGIVNFCDFVLLALQFGATTPEEVGQLPEPTSTALVLLGGLIGFHRWRLRQNTHC